MGSSLVQTRSDTDLIAAVADGDTAAFGLLFARHRDAAERLARQLTQRGDADDLVSEAFVKVLAQLQDGRGPQTAFRAYLLTVIRRLHIDRIRVNRRVEVTDEPSRLDRGEEFFDTAVAGFEQGAAARAFASLPERWQVVLWHVDVEGQRPAEVAPLLGMSANSVSALLYRAREGLRQAYLRFHLAEVTESDCRWTTERLGSHVRDGLSARETHRIEAHLDSCRRCMGVYLELREIASDLRGLLGPVVLGGALAGYTAAGAAAQKGLFFAAWESVRSSAGQIPSAAGSGLQAAATVAVVGVLATAGTVAAVRGPDTLVAQTSPGETPTQDVSPGSSEADEPANDTADPGDPGDPGDPADDAIEEAEEEAGGDTPVTPTPSASDPAPSDPAPTPSPSPSPTPPPVADADFGITQASAPEYGRLLQRLASVEFSAQPAGGTPREHEVIATISFDAPIVYRGVRGGAWTCRPSEFDVRTTVRCTTRTTAAPAPLEVKVQRLGPVTGSVSIESSPNSDPNSANDSARF